MADKLAVIGQFVTLGLVAFGVLKGYFSDNKSQDSRIDKIETTCKLKHESIDDKQLDIRENLLLIKENHLKHIEERMTAIENKNIEIITILNERLPKK